MYKSLSAIFVILCFIAAALPSPVNATDNNSTNSVLDSAENLFLSLKNKKFNITWSLLSEKSKETIINDVYKASRKIGGEATKEDIRQDFNNSGAISNSYWNAFLDTFDPDMILEKSRWEISFIEDHKAEIIIMYKKSEEPALLKISKENNIWKVGLVETFWTRKF